MATALEADLLTRLEPWVPTLQRNARLPAKSSGDASPSDVFWIDDFSWNCCTGRDRRMHIEAIELLSLLARVDWRLWRRAAKMIWPTHALQWEETFEVSSFEVGFVFLVSRGTGVERLSEGITAVPRLFPPSRDYNELKMTMTTLLRERGASVATVPIRLIFPSTMKQEQMTLELFKILQHDLAVKHFSPESVSGFCGGLGIRELKFDLSRLDIDATVCRYVFQIAALGIRIPHLLMMKPEVYNSHRDLFRQTLWTLLDVGDEQPTHDEDSSFNSHDQLGATKCPPSISHIFRASRQPISSQDFDSADLS